MSQPSISASDRDILRRLCAEVAELAQLPIQAERAALWTRLNDLQPVRPLIWITELPWHELNVDDELTLRCENGWARGWENRFRQQLYQWRHLPGDMILSRELVVGKAIRNTGFGIAEEVDIVRTDPASGVVSRHFKPQIHGPEDLDKIRSAEVSYDESASLDSLAAAEAMFGDLLPVRLGGVKHIWYTPWDNLIRWWGVEQAMLDMIDRPEMVNEAVSRTAASMHAYLDGLEALNLLDCGADNTRVGSGGYGYTKALPAAGFDPDRVRAIDTWGCSNAQIFSEVSPAMHWEFALQHDLDWLARWGLTYYGCCEPLDLKVDILRRVPNLRKISMNYRIQVERAIDQVGGDYVFSYKPNPAWLAEARWRPEQARRELVELLERARGCHIELILKDISTVAYDPRRVWDWAAMAAEVVENYWP